MDAKSNFFIPDSFNMIASGFFYCSADCSLDCGRKQLCSNIDITMNLSTRCSAYKQKETELIDEEHN